ncbi:hypothetical protein LENED_011794 [Lentinula edodes]|uniref:Uncharacterized protein n=1 Tax=Lentinula edodes TaxID=5353 RepID=A0A1Q3EQZ5_LENED|nr:hypothetical protein LENED_011794 [Lentinula edodes]
MSTLKLTETQALALQALLYREEQLPPALQEVLAALPLSRDLDTGIYLSSESSTHSYISVNTHIHIHKVADISLHVFDRNNDRDPNCIRYHNRYRNPICNHDPNCDCYHNPICDHYHDCNPIRDRDRDLDGDRNHDRDYDRDYYHNPIRDHYHDCNPIHDRDCDYYCNPIRDHYCNCDVSIPVHVPIHVYDHILFVDVNHNICILFVDVRVPDHGVLQALHALRHFHLSFAWPSDSWAENCSQVPRSKCGY